MKAIVGLTALALMLMAVPASAEDPPHASCEVPAYLLTTESKLPKVAEAIKTDQKLDILVIGSRSATIGAPSLVGRTAWVLQTVTTTDGRVKLAGETWSARLAEGATPVTPGHEVRVVSIQGATAFVAGTALPDRGE